jgi:hypothetical protein
MTGSRGLNVCECCIISPAMVTYNDAGRVSPDEQLFHRLVVTAPTCYHLLFWLTYISGPPQRAGNHSAKIIIAEQAQEHDK